MRLRAGASFNRQYKQDLEDGCKKVQRITGVQMMIFRLIPQGILIQKPYVK